MKKKNLALAAAACLLLAACAVLPGASPAPSAGPEPMPVAPPVSAPPPASPAAPPPESAPASEPAPEPMEPSLYLGIWDIAEPTEDGTNIPLFRLALREDGSAAYGAGWLESEWALYFEGSYTVRGNEVDLVMEPMYGEGEPFSASARIEPDGSFTRIITRTAGEFPFPHPSDAPTVFTDSDTLLAEVHAQYGG